MELQQVSQPGGKTHDPGALPSHATATSTRWLRAALDREGARRQRRNEANHATTGRPTFCAGANPSETAWYFDPASWGLERFWFNNNASSSAATGLSNLARRSLTARCGFHLGLSALVLGAVAGSSGLSWCGPPTLSP